MSFRSMINGSLGILPRSISGDRIANGAVGLTQMVHGTWQAPTPGTGWATGPASGSVQPIQYRLGPLDQVEIVGSMHTTSATPGSTLFTLTGFTPTQNQRVPAVLNNAGTVSAAYIEVKTTGAVAITPVPTAANVDLYVCSAPTLGNSA